MLMVAEVETKPAKTELWEWVCAIVAFAVPVLFLALYGGCWLAWGDEAQFADPAASLYYGQGFTSTAWPYQVSTEFFAGNAPGYSLLLAPWFKLFGFGLYQARALNWALMVAAGLVLWRGLSYCEPRLPLWLKALAIGIAFMGSGILLSYWSARYDALGIMVASVIFLLLARPQTRKGDAGLAIAGFALFYAGFHLVAAAVVLSALFLLQDRRKYQVPAIALLAGVCVAGLTWLAAMAFNGLLKKFFIITFGSQHTISGQMAQLVLQGDQGVFKKLALFKSIVTMDLSLSVFALVLGGLFLARFAGARTDSGGAEGFSGRRALARMSLNLVLITPVALLLLGKFPIYYTWMAYVPAVFIAVIIVARLRQRGMRWPTGVFVASGLLAATLGVVARMEEFSIDRGSATYSRFDDWVRSTVKPADTAYSDFEAYFSARSVAQRVIVPTYGKTSLVKGIPEKDAVSVILVQAAHALEVMPLLGGNWQEVARFRDEGADLGGLPPKLAYVALRRVPAKAGS